MEFSLGVIVGAALASAYWYWDLRGFKARTSADMSRFRLETKEQIKRDFEDIRAAYQSGQK